MEYCGKHDKIFREGETCFGCDTEKEQAALKGPDDTIAELRTPAPGNAIPNATKQSIPETLPQHLRAEFEKLLQSLGL